MIDDFITILGIVLVCLGAAFLMWRHVKRAAKLAPNKGDIPVGLSVGILGILLIIQDRIIEVPTPFGAIHTQALADAGDIAKLKTQAENQTATINLVAGEATKAKTLSETVSGQVTEAQKKLASLDAATAAAQATLDSLKQEEDFVMTVVAALGDDRKSFDKLRTLAGDKSNRFAETAGQVWLSIYEAHSGPLSQSGFSSPWVPGVDPAKYTMEQLSEIYAAVESQLKPNLLEYISRRNDIPKQARADFMMKVMKSDQSLLAMEYAGRYFTQITGQQIKAMALDYLSHWWDEHRHEFDGK